MSQKQLNHLNLPLPKGNIFTDGVNYLINSVNVSDNQSGTLLDIGSVSISLEVYTKINSVSEKAKEIDKPTPNSLSKATSWLASRDLAKYKKSPTFVNATFDGGIMLEYYLENDLYIMLEFFNDGDIVCLMKKAGIRKTYQINKGREIESLLQPVLNGGSL